jgi:hypothetical protein
MAVNRRASRIEVEIGELVLHGFASSDRLALAEGLGKELERQLKVGRLVARRSTGTIPHPSGDSLSVRVSKTAIRSAPRAGANVIGTLVGRKIYEGLAE